MSYQRRRVSSYYIGKVDSRFRENDNLLDEYGNSIEELFNKFF